MNKLSEPIRLLYLIAEEWPTFRPDVAVLFGRWLPRFGVLSDLVTVAHGSHSDTVEPWGGGRPVLRKLVGGQAKRRLTMFLHGLKAVWGASASRYDAVQVRDMPILATFVLLVCRLKGLPFYYWMSYPMPEGQIALARERGISAGLMKFFYPLVSGWLGYLLLYRVVLPLSDHVFVQSPRMKDELAGKNGLAPSKMTPVLMGVDFDSVDCNAVRPTEDPRLAGRRVLVYLGTLDRPRGIPALFEMLGTLKKRHPELVLVLVGDTADDPHRQYLHDCAERSGVLSSVVWTGWLPTLEAWRYLRVATIALSPIPRGPLLDVGSPTKLLEYLMFSLPVVCNDNPDQASVMASCGAGRCVAYTAPDFAAAVEELLSLGQDALAAMGLSGRSYVGQVRNYRHIGEELAQRYGALVAARRR